MKKVIFAAMALVALASCTSDEMIGVTNPQDNSSSEDSNAIVFNSAFKGVTRADQVGSKAAETLQNQFIVYATKHAATEAVDATNDLVVFQNYVVEYTANSAGKTTSNTHNWEYVGKTPYAAANVSPTVTSVLSGSTVITKSASGGTVIDSLQ